MYTISEVSKMFNIPVSTLRYYDYQGLFPDIKRQSGIRQFNENELETLRMIDSMKKSGLEIKEIRQFMEWTTEGSATYEKRFEMLDNQRKAVETEIGNMLHALDMLKFKCWYYQTAMQQGNEDNLTDINNPAMPPEIRRAYIDAHRYTPHFCAPLPEDI